MQYDSTPLRPTTQDLTGRTFTRWTVIQFAGYRRAKGDRLKPYWTCQCICGSRKDIEASSLVAGPPKGSQSCGCLRNERTRMSRTTHGMHDCPEYGVWVGMRYRCTKPYSSGYHKYGARGITVCEAWQDFETFYRDMGPRPSPQHSIERLRNNEGYGPDNCVWATRSIQQRNKKSTVYITHNNTTMCLAAWADFSHIPQRILRQRLSRGWSMQEALTIRPTRSRRELRCRKP